MAVSIKVSKGGAIAMLILALIFLIPGGVILLISEGNETAMGIGACLMVPGVCNLIQFFRMLYKLDEIEKIKVGLEKLRELERETYRPKLTSFNENYSLKEQVLKYNNTEVKEPEFDSVPEVYEGNRCPYCGASLDGVMVSEILNLIICPLCQKLIKPVF